MKKIILIIVLIMFVLLPALLLFLLFPGSTFGSLSSEPSPVPQSPVMDERAVSLHEEWIRNRLLPLVHDALPERGLSLQGLAVAITREGVSLTVGVEIDLPVLPIIDAFPLMLRLRLPITWEEELGIGVDQVKIGRLPIPAFLLRRVLKGVDESADLASLQLPLPHRVDIDAPALYLDLNPFLDSLFPGTRAVDVSTVPDHLQIALALPEQLSQSVQELASLFAGHKEGLRDAVAAALPAEKQEMAEQIEEVLAVAASFTSPDGDALASLGREEAIVSYCEGEAEAGIEGGEFYPLEFGQSLPPGTTVRTGKSSYAELLLPGDNVIKMDESTVLVLEHCFSDGDVHQNSVRQVSGALRSRVAKLKGIDSFYEIKVHTAVMGVRGTDFCTFAERRNEMRIAVLEGEVLVETEESDPLTLLPDETVAIADGKSGGKEPVSDELRSSIDTELEVKTSEEDIRYLSRRNFSAFIMPKVLQYADMWDRLASDEKWEMQYALEDYMAANPGLSRQVDIFFQENNLQDKRKEIEAMFQ